MKPARILAALAMALALAACSDGNDNNNRQVNCVESAAQALNACLNDLSNAIAACYDNGDAHCAEDDASVLAAADALASTVTASCSDGEFIGMSVDDTLGRLQASCTAQADSVAWRTYGGPQGAVWPTVDDTGKDCLQSAHASAAAFMDASLTAINECLADDACDPGAVATARQAAHDTAVADVAAACPTLSDLIAVEPEIYIGNAADQVDCIAATTHADTGPLTFTCGPGYAEASPARGEWLQVVLDSDKWGSMCGDGTDYAFHIRLAPEGEPVDNVIVGLQGGGVCIFENDCRSRLENAPGLFNAQDDSPLGLGLVSDAPENPFADWTKIYLPYCNQDVFIGGGVLEQFSDFTVPRYGTLNLRAAMRAARDIIWQEMDAAGGPGFRPDELVALFGGFSAGAYGTLYNYHWVLDDLQWPRTAAFPDAGGALDNGGVGVRTLGFVKIPEWGAKPYLPPYCFVGDCAVGPDNYMAASPRLKQVPEQQYLILSNQKDNTQQGDAFFADEAQWINAMRAAYCDTKDLPGIQWYLTSDSVNSVHVVSVRDEFYYGEVAGERMVDWFWRAVTDPDSISDWAEEGNFVTDIPGSEPFPCELP